MNKLLFISAFVTLVPFSSSVMSAICQNGVPCVAMKEIQGNPLAALQTQIDSLTSQLSSLQNAIDDINSRAIDGAGTDNFIPRWNDTFTLENSVIYQDDSGNIGVNTVNPQYKLDVSNGSIGISSASFFTNNEGFYETNQIIGTQRIGSITGGSTSADDSPFIIRSHDAIQLKTSQKFVPPWPDVITRIHISGGGNVGIGTVNPQAKLHVVGDIIAEGGIMPDYVFEKDYKLISLDALQEFISLEGHLPNIQNADEVKNKGLNIAKFQMDLLRKIEELTLYVLAQNRQIKEQQDLIDSLNKRVKKLR